MLFPTTARRDGSYVAGPVSIELNFNYISNDLRIYSFRWRQNPITSQVRHPVLIYCWN